MWCRLGEIVEINPKNLLDDELDVSFVPMTMISDKFSNNHVSETRKWKEIKKGFTHFREGDIGVAKITPCFENRKSVIFANLTNKYGAGTTELHILRPYSKLFFSQYLLWFVKSGYFIDNGISNFTGAVGQQRVGKNIIESTPFPLPKIAEQKRIVTQIEKIFSQLDQIEEALKA
jgi:type I restriction enzyme S subunit